MKTARLTVFMYHRILPFARQDGVSVDCFRKQLRCIRRHYHIIRGEDCLSLLCEGGQHRHYAMITFDDGWLDNWIYATPVLKEEGLPAVLALTSGTLHDTPVREAFCADAVMESDEAYRRSLYEKDHRSYLSRDEVCAMVTSGCWNIQCHGHVHAKHFHDLNRDGAVYPDADDACLRHALGGRIAVAGLPVGSLVSDQSWPWTTVDQGMLQVTQTESLSSYSTRLDSDLTQCRSAVKSLTGTTPKLLFWPWGHHSQYAIDRARACGFSRSFGVFKQSIALPSTDFVLPRVGVSENRRKFVRNAFVFYFGWSNSLHTLISKNKASGWIQ